MLPILLLLVGSFFPVGSQAGESADIPLRFRLTAEPATLDWNLARSSHETHIIMNVMEGLVEEGADLKPQPALAKSWDISADGRTYTFHLRPGVLWSDGKPLKASDFRDSWLRLLNPKTKSSYASFLFEVENAEAFNAGTLKDATRVGVEAPDDLTFRVKLRSTVPYFLHLPSFWVAFPIRLDLIKKHGVSWATPGKIATLGPYRLTEWNHGKSIVLVRNPTYYGSQPAVERVTAVIEPDDAKARGLFERGKLDFLLNATTGDLLKARAAGASTFRAEQFPYLATYYLGFNAKSGPFKDVEVRRAIALTVDLAEIPGRLQGGQIPAKSWLPPGIDGHDREISLSGTQHDSMSEFKKAGYSESNRFPKQELWVENFDGAAELGRLISESANGKLGIELVPHIASPLEYQKQLKSGGAAIFIGHWGADYPDASNFFEVFEKESGTNSTGWTDDEYDRDLKTAAATLDPVVRGQAYEAAERILLQKDVVILPLFYKRNTVLLGPRVKVLGISPLNYLFLKTVQLSP